MDIYTPADTPAGVYNGTATISSSQGTSTVHVGLNVWNFPLPKERSLHGSTNTTQSLRSRTTAVELLKHRFNPKTVDRADERFLIDNYGLDMVHVYRSGGASYGNCQTDPAPLVSDVLNATANHEPELYLYTSYANEVWACTSLYPEFLAWATNLRLGGSHPAIVTFPVDELMGPDLDHTAADIWSVLPKHYDQAKTNIEKLINHPSTRVWSYNPLVQDGYSPKFTIDFLPINARIMQGFINQSLGLTGTKFWRVDYWTNDPWNNAEAIRADAPGEGHMVYPGDDVGLANQIVSGVRMKWFREGSEDYEYIQILKDLGQEQFALSTARTVAVDFHTWSQDKDVLYAARKLLGEKIHSLNSEVTVEVRVAASSDDAEESASGNASLTSSDLELVSTGSNQTVGMRFNGVAVPPGATIVKAYVQFQADETHTETTAVTIQGEAHDNAPTFVHISGNVSSRARTAAAVSWAPAPWTTRGEAGPNQQTPDITAVIQEIVDRPGWTGGNSLVVIITGTGERTAEAYDGDQAGAPLLHVEYYGGS